jgi:hypothetical protein
MPLPSEVIVHPLVLLSAVDHYARVAKDTRKRVVGVLLGEVFKGKLDVTNSFAGGGCRRAAPVMSRRQHVPRSPHARAAPRRAPAAVPFDEDAKDPRVWFLDHNYMETMNGMCRKISGARAPSWRIACARARVCISLYVCVWDMCVCVCVRACVWVRLAPRSCVRACMRGCADARRRAWVPARGIPARPHGEACVRLPLSAARRGSPSRSQGANRRLLQHGPEAAAR